VDTREICNTAMEIPLVLCGCEEKMTEEEGRMGEAL
jgi:hypothetical protein